MRLMTNSLSILLLQSILSNSHYICVLLKELLSKGHHEYIVSIHESDIKDKLAQNMAYAVSIVIRNLYKYILLLDKTITYSTHNINR